jgi:hypothetical protein
LAPGNEAARQSQRSRQDEAGNLDDLLTGKSNRYRRIYESWDISDYAFRYDLYEAAQPLTLVWIYERVNSLDDLLD